MDWIKTLMQDSEPSTTLKASLFWQDELEHQQESGVVFLNKAIPSAFMSLLFTAYMNTLKVRGDVYSNVAGTYPLPRTRPSPKAQVHRLTFSSHLTRRQRNLLARLRALLSPLHLRPQLRQHNRHPRIRPHRLPLQTNGNVQRPAPPPRPARPTLLVQLRPALGKNDR